jgi:hypothetical protein
MKSDPSVALRPNQDARNDDSDGGSSSEGVNSYLYIIKRDLKILESALGTSTS